MKYWLYIMLVIFCIQVVGCEEDDARNKQEKKRKNRIPIVVINNCYGTKRGDVKIRFGLFDRDDDICSIKVEYKGGKTKRWSKATDNP